MLVKENDEWQHMDRLEWCECSRMINISQSAGMPVVFLRYNPDPYRVKGKLQNPTVNKRRETLLRWVAHLKVMPPRYFVSVVRLFFDDYDESNVAVECILPLEKQ